MEAPPEFELTLFCCSAVIITISPILQRYNFEFISAEFPY